MTHRFARLRRFRFNLPQRIAAGLLCSSWLQGLWLTSRQTLTDRDYQYARCGREMWERPSALAGYYTTCGNIHDGILAYRLAGLPLTLNLAAERALDHFRKPEDRVVQAPSGESSTWELRHQITHILLLLRLPFLFAGCVSAGALVGHAAALRQPGRLHGACALLLFSRRPQGLRRAQSRGAGRARRLRRRLYRIGVAHAMQGPRRKWRPRIVLLTLLFGVAAASHIAALPVAALLGLVVMLWVAEGRRSQALPVVLLGFGRRAGAGLCLLRLLSRCLQLCLPLRCGLPLVLA